MKLLSPALLVLLPALAGAIWRHGHRSDPNAIYRRGDPHDDDFAGAARYHNHDNAAARAAADYGNAAAGEGAGGLGHHHHKHHYKSVGCDVRYRPIESLMGTAATQCAECLTATAIEANDDDNKHEPSHYYSQPYNSYGQAKCKNVCSYIPRGSEFFVPFKLLKLIKQCRNGSECYQSTRSNETCQCCGHNLGMNYNMPSASPTDFLSELSNFRRTCDEPTAASNCVACLLWRKLRGKYFSPPYNQSSLPCTQGEQCFVIKDHEHTLMGTAVVDDPYHYLLLPGSSQADWPVIGIEDPQVLTRRLEKIWDLAWKAAYRPYSLLPYTKPFSVPDLPVANHSCRIGIALNPASARSQHQMHIHIARIPTPLRQLFVGREENYGEWTKVLIPITKINYSSRPIAYARYFSLDGDDDDDMKPHYYYGHDDAEGARLGYGKKGNMTGSRLSYYKIFRLVFAFARHSLLRLQAWGILIIPDEESIYLRDKHAPTPRGFYLVLSTHNQYGTWNSYRATAVNANYQPELLLCTTYSTADGNYWRPDECYADLLMRNDCGPGLRKALYAGGKCRWMEGFAQQQLVQDGNTGTNNGGWGQGQSQSGGKNNYYGGGSSGTNYYGPGAGMGGGAYSGSVSGSGYASKTASTYYGAASGSGDYIYTGGNSGGGAMTDPNWYSISGAGTGTGSYSGTGAGTGTGSYSGTGSDSGGSYSGTRTGAGSYSGTGTGTGNNNSRSYSNTGTGTGAGTYSGTGTGAGSYMGMGTGSGDGGSYTNTGGGTGGGYANTGAGTAAVGAAYAAPGTQSFGLRGAH